jgi:putative transposase
LTHEERKVLIVPDDPDFSIAQQSDLLGISRSSFYYHGKENPEDKKRMDLIDRIYTDYPFYGSRRVKNELWDRNQLSIGREQVQRLMRRMGIEAIYPKKAKNTSVRDDSHRKYPYLLNGIVATYPNHIWGTDITYIRMETGWAYLVAILDWYSRYVIAWELSLSMETGFCITTLDRALQIGMPLLHNSDQGVQFTDKRYVGILAEKKIGISMDGRGRCMDNIFTERLWRTVKYENVFLRSYRNIEETKAGLEKYFLFYNTKRRHQSLEYQTPISLYVK